MSYKKDTKARAVSTPGAKRPAPRLSFSPNSRDAPRWSLPLKLAWLLHQVPPGCRSPERSVGPERGYPAGHKLGSQFFRGAYTPPTSQRLGRGDPPPTFRRRYSPEATSRGRFSEPPESITLESLWNFRLLDFRRESSQGAFHPALTGSLEVDYRAYFPLKVGKPSTTVCF